MHEYYPSSLHCSFLQNVSFSCYSRLRAGHIGYSGVIAHLIFEENMGFVAVEILHVVVLKRSFDFLASFLESEPVSLIIHS